MPAGRPGKHTAPLPARETQVWAEKQVREIKRETGRGRVALVFGRDPAAWQSVRGSVDPGFWPVPGTSAWRAGPSAPGTRVGGSMPSVAGVGPQPRSCRAPSPCKSSARVAQASAPFVTPAGSRTFTGQTFAESLLGDGHMLVAGHCGAQARARAGHREQARSTAPVLDPPPKAPARP